MRRIAALVAVGAGIVAARRLGRRAGRGRHSSESPEEYGAARHRILVLGSGFGGLATCLGLDRRLGGREDVSILAVDRDSAMLFHPLMWTVASGRANPNDVVVPIRAFQRDRDFHVLHATIESIDLKRREVRTSAGVRPYDYLVIALGSTTAIPDLPGLAEHALRFHTPADALELRNHLIDAVEQAHYIADPAERAEWLTFVVGGGGDTGVELAATIHEYLAEGLLKAYPWLATESPRIVVVGRAERLVSMSGPEASAKVEEVLRGEGIEVWTGTSINGVTERAVQTSRGPIPARTLFWAAGITAPEVVRALPVEHARNGSLIVDETLRLPGRPEIFVVGDSAWAFDRATGDPVPPTAQASEHMGAYVAGAIAALVEGRQPEPFRFKTKGRLALLGRQTGVAEVFGHTFSGLPAWVMWHAYYLSHIPSWRNRLRLVIDWTLAGLMGRETAQLRLDAKGMSRSTAEAVAGTVATGGNR